jgi:hypothetical protein
MFAKIVIIAVLLGILASLGAALVFMVKDRGQPTGRTARALTLRIGISVALFLLLFVLWWAGIIAPHGVTP